MTARKPKDQLQKRGRKSGFRSEFIRIAFIAAKYGAIEEEIARDLGVSRFTLNNWKHKHPEFANALRTAKEVCDTRMERSLYHRGVGYSHDAVKILVVNGKVVKVPYVEHYPPDSTSMIFFLKNRMPDRWRDVQRVEAELGHYVISERPMTEEEWIREHATPLIDVTGPVLSQEDKKDE